MLLLHTNISDDLLSKNTFYCRVCYSISSSLGKKKKKVFPEIRDSRAYLCFLVFCYGLGLLSCLLILLHFFLLCTGHICMASCQVSHCILQAMSERLTPPIDPRALPTWLKVIPNRAGWTAFYSLASFLTILSFFLDLDFNFRILLPIQVFEL